MATLTDIPSLTSHHSFPAISFHQNSSTSLTFLNSQISFSNFNSFFFTIKSSKCCRISSRRSRFRCSIAKDSTISPTASGRDELSAYSVDCVVVGAGISGLCVAQALSTKHRDIASKVIVTEAQNRAGGNISTMERDGYLWEEGPNSFQPSDTMLSVAV